MKKYALLVLVLCFFSILLSKDYNYETDLYNLRNIERADSLHGFDAIHYDLEIDISMNDSIYGIMTMDAVANDNITSVDLELEQLNVGVVKVDDVVVNYNYDSHIINIPVNIADGSNFTVEVTYYGTPQLSDDGYNLGLSISNSYAYTMSDPSGVRWWMPAYDHPWDKATIDYHVKIREDWLVACNGLRTGVENVVPEGKRIHHWSSSDPLALHVACITAADFVELSSVHNGLVIQNFVVSSIVAEAVHDFTELPMMIDTYSNYYGQYPFEKYGNTVVPIQTFGAMEHQTMTTLGTGIIDGQNGGEHTIAHELSHHWFGNSLTPLTWKDVWLSEGFAVLSEAVYDEAKYGHESMLDYIENNIHNVYKNWANSNGPRVIYDPVWSEYFAPPSYEKAASVLLALRGWVGEQVFKHILQTWFSENSNQNVVTQEFIDLVKRETNLSDTDVDTFFNQWIYSDGLPGFKYIVLYNNDIDEIMPVIKTTSTTQTEFDIKMPFVIEYNDSNKDTIIVSAVSDIPDVLAGYSLQNSIVTGAELDPENWIISTEKREYNVELRNVYSSNNAVILDWDNVSEIFECDGYEVQRRTGSNDTFQSVNNLTVTDSYYIDETAQSGIDYEYRVGLSKNGYLGAWSDTMSVRSYYFSMDQGVLVIDESADINGIPGFPSDDGCDYFYDRILDTPITELDYNNGDSLNLNVLGMYSTVILHDDDNVMKRIDEYQQSLIGYIAGGGNLIISGWETPDYIDRDIYRLLGLSYDFGININRDFVSASNGEYNLTLDSSKLDPGWNEMLSGIMYFENEDENDGFIRLKYHGENSVYENYNVVRHKEFDAGNHVILFGFPLYYTTPDGTKEYMDYILNYLGEEVSVKETEKSYEMYLDFTVLGNPVVGNQVSFSMKNLQSDNSEVSIYNIKGQRVYKEVLTKKDHNTVNWNLKNSSNRRVASGVYFARLKSGNQQQVRKFVIMK